MSDLPSSAQTYRRITGVDPLAAKRIGNEYAVPCVNRGSHTHGDKAPSLHISAKDTGWTCRVCGVGGGSIALVKFAGLAKTDAEALTWLGVEKDAPVPPVQRQIVATYPYADIDGTLRYEVVRYEPKGFQQRRRDASGNVVWNLDGVARLPYRLKDLRAAVAEKRTILVVEGEKDADSLVGLGFTATTNAAGAAWKWTADFVAHFAGSKRIIVLADNDDAGRTAARIRANILREVCGDVRLIEHLPGVAEKGDVSDLIASGYTPDKLKTLFAAATPVRALVEQLDSVVARQQAAPPPPPPIPTGFACIDLTVGGLRRGQTSVFGARPGVGKSAFAEHLAAFIAEKYRVLFFSIEMGTDRSVDRLVARLLSMHESEYLRNNRPIDAAKLSHLDMHFAEMNSMEQISETVMLIKPDFVILDHTRELEGWFKVEKGSRADISAAVIMGQIVRLGKTSGAHMAVFSQCSRSADNKRPTLSDLRDSGAVEEKADNVFFLHRPFQYDTREKDDVAEFIAWKTRGAGAFIGHMRWTGTVMLFDNPPPGEEHGYTRCCPVDARIKNVAVAG
jgi:hypothetical protein